MRLLALRLNKHNLIFSGSLYQHWPWPRPLLGNQPWEAPQGDALCVPPHSSDTCWLHIHTHTHILITNYYTYRHIPKTPDPHASVALNRQPDKRSGPALNSAAGPGWLLARAGLPPLLQSRVSMLWLCAFCCWGVFFLFSHCTPKRSIVWGFFFFFFLLSHLMYAVYFFNSLSSCPVYPLVILYVCMDRLMANFAGTCD